MSTDRLGVGVVGMGGIATMHARALRELGERVRLVAYSGGADPATPPQAQGSAKPTSSGAPAFPAAVRPPVDTIHAPPFPREAAWVNVAPLRMDKQRGRPVLIEFFDGM